MVWIADPACGPQEVGRIRAERLIKDAMIEPGVIWRDNAWRRGGAARRIAVVIFLPHLSILCPFKNGYPFHGRPAGGRENSVRMYDAERRESAVEAENPTDPAGLNFQERRPVDPALRAPAVEGKVD